MSNYRNDRAAAELALSAAMREADSNRSRMSHLQARVEKLSLTCSALWELVKQKTGATDEELEAWVAGISQEKNKPRPCVQCSRPVGAGITRCIFCGTDQPAANIFETL